MSDSGKTTFDTLVAREAKKVVLERIDELKESLVHVAEYQSQSIKTAGMIVGLRSALEALEMAEERVLKR
jgi:hypothetical protein